jgi:hypothetical protein
MFCFQDKRRKQSALGIQQSAFSQFGAAGLYQLQNRDLPEGLNADCSFPRPR